MRIFKNKFFIIIMAIMMLNTAARATDQLISREILFGNAEKILVRLSSDGNYISYVAPFENIMNIWVAPIDDLSKAYPITHDKNRGIHRYSWAKNNKHIIYSQDTNGDENSKLYSVDIETKATKLLTPKNKVRAYILSMSYDFPEDILVSHNRRDPGVFDVYKINVVTAKETEIFKNTEDYLGFTSNSNMKIIFATKMLPSGEKEIYKFSDDMKKPELFHTIKIEDMLTTSLLHISYDNSKFYMMDSAGRNNPALFEIDSLTGKKKIIFESPKSDIDGYMADPKTYEIEAVSTNYKRVEWNILDKSLEEDFAVLKEIKDADLDVISRSHQDDKWIISYSSSDAPHHYYFYDRKEKKASFLFSSNSKQDDLPFSKMHPVKMKSKDGLDLINYLTIPKHLGNSIENIKEPMPLILYVHGGPNVRDHWGFRSDVQWLANRGYAVLQVNYRSSTGFGKDFINAGDGEWSGKMQRDLEDSVQYCIDKGITTQDKVVIMGGSYGGYATLVGMTMTPDLYVAGIDIVGIANLETFKKSVPKYWELFQAHLTKMLGTDGKTPEGIEILKKKSPINYVNNIKNPLLIIQGANDPRVNKNESDQIADKMKELGIPYMYLLYPDEGHGLLKPGNKMSMYAYIESFLSKIVGGRLESHDGKFPNSSIEIQKGSNIEWLK